MTPPKLSDALSRKSLATQVYENLELAIIEGRLRPGTRLGEDAIASAFAVSRSPAREAIVELERVGLAEKLPNRDRRVTVPTERFITDVFDVWTLLESERLYESSRAAAPAAIAEIENLLKALDRGTAATPVERERQLQAFHQLLQNACPNQQLHRVADDWYRYIRWLRALYVDYHKIVSTTAMKEHREIVRAFRKQDREKLTAVMRSHIRAHHDVVLEAWKKTQSGALAASARSLPFALEGEAA